MPGSTVRIQQTNTGQYVITIPVAIVRLKGWKKGTPLELIEDKNHEISLREKIRLT
jgi:bifunctional DNA-binding transcriptional regulator/antitoxin component of YhaV-PrlF toxin-antitoxin module